MGEFASFLQNNLADFWTYTGFHNATLQHVVMILVGIFFIYLAVAKEFEPMLLIPIGFGILIGNIPFNMEAGLKVGIYEEGSVLNILYQGVTSGWYPPLIFLGIGAMTDFSALISNPKLMLIGAAAQFGIFGAYMIALEIGFDPMQAAAIGIIGGADGPTAIFLSSKLAPNLMGSNCRVCLFVYGTCSCYTTSCNAIAYNKEGTSYPYESTSCRITYRKGYVPDYRFVAYLLPGSFRSVHCWVCCSSVIC